ncbi:B3 domain-containing transcription factor VRN1-like [Cannabis sativa]|uniref:B3 domain-containing transcription factor VRN1-like n=1 Tax=Cannabis sativa TaxID=3483 RepID=UPI0029C9C7F5|nr:B3 domain-containing transcription factor VRN1-like [Cannabis sativa]
MLKYGTSTIDTSNPIVLKVPSGGAWEVKLTKFDDDDHLWLGEGWPEFARHHSIKCGYTLYFRYEGQSRFYVVIVNENGSEIDYPVNDSKHFDKINPDFDKLLMPLPEKGEKKTKIFIVMKLSSTVRRFKACAKWGDGLGEHFVVPSIKTLMTIKEKEKEKDLSRNENLASQNPFFKSVIQKRHLHIQYDMALPKNFWRQNMNENSCHYITLHVPHDQNKIWPVRLYVRLRSTCLFRRAAFRKKDWQRFVDENHLKVGDVCIFELIDKNEMKFQVTINRANSEDNTMKFGTSSKVINGTAFEDDKLFGGEIKQSNPSFRLKLAVSGSRVQQRIPIRFSRQFFKEKPKAVRLKVGKKCWDVNLAHCGGGVVLCGGWPAFAKDNRLVPGDSLIFKLITNQVNHTLLEVTIISHCIGN